MTSMMAESPEDDMGFTYHIRKNGDVHIHHHGRLATTLRGRDARLSCEATSAPTWTHNNSWRGSLETTGVGMNGGPANIHAIGVSAVWCIVEG